MVTDGDQVYKSSEGSGWEEAAGVRFFCQFFSRFFLSRFWPDFFLPISSLISEYYTMPNSGFNRSYPVTLSGL